MSIIGVLARKERLCGATKRWQAADEHDFMLFLDYIASYEPTERVVLPRCNPFEEYDDKKFRQRFRLSKFAVVKLLEQLNTYTSRF